MTPLFRRRGPEPDPVFEMTGLVRRFLRDFPPTDWPEVAAEMYGIGKVGQDVSSFFEPMSLIFAEGQPDCFWEHEGGIPYRGQENAKRRIDIYLRALSENGRAKFLLTGPAGTGKTTLARIIAARLGREPYYELLPAQVEDKAKLDAFFRQIANEPYATVFIDEIHTLSNLEAFFHVLHDTGQPRYPLSDGSWIEIPSTISWIAATTDPGQLDKTTGGAMRRRLEPEIRLEPPTRDDLAQMLMDQGQVDMDIHPDAAYDIAERSGGLPWQAHLIRKEARNFAKVAGSEMILPGHADQAFEVMEIDKLGLRREDRDVIAALLRVPSRLATTGEIRYKMSEATLCAAAGVDPHTYRKRVQPKLMRLGLLTVIGGQCLTEKAVELYGWLAE